MLGASLLPCSALLRSAGLRWGTRRTLSNLANLAALSNGGPYRRGIQSVSLDFANPPHTNPPRVSPVLASASVAERVEIPHSVVAPSQVIDNVFVVDSVAKAERALRIMSQRTDVVWACDTEVSDIDVKEVYVLSYSLLYPI